jgi:hypothetical protein
VDYTRHAQTIAKSTYALRVVATRGSGVMVNVVHGHDQFALAGEHQQSE